jgi:hypothetical protein
MRLRWLLLAGFGALLLTLIGNIYRAQTNYSRAVELDARARGIDPRRLRYPAHWPLEVFDSALRSAESPEAAEKIALGADSVLYYLVPISGGSRDTAVVQRFCYQVGPRKNSIVVDYLPNQPPRVDGSDAVPGSRYRVSRDVALAWYARLKRRSQ